VSHQPPTPAASHPIPSTPTPAPRRRTAEQTQVPFQTPEAEQADRPLGRRSASDVSPRAESASGFDALFAGIADDEEADEVGSRGGRPTRSERSGRSDRKAAKAEKAARAEKGGKSGKARFGKPAAAGPRRSGGIPNSPASPASAATAAVDLAALVGGTMAPGATSMTAPAAADSSAGFAAALSAAAGAPAPPAAPDVAPSAFLPAPPVAPMSSTPQPASSATTPLAFDSHGRRATTDPFDFSTDVAADLFGLTAEPSTPTVSNPAPTPRGDARSAPLDAGATAAVSPASSRDDRRRHQPARDSAHQAPRRAKVRVRVSARPQSQPAASAPRGRRGRRFVASLAAMSFAALLAVATTIPSLSLLTPSDVQALALSSTYGPALDGQRVVLNGDIVAQSVQREGYESQTIEEYARAAGIRPEATFTNNPSGTIQWPFAVGVHIGDRFGYRDCWGCSSNHGGQDFNPGLGAEIQAIADGVVSNSTDSGGSLGVVMMIDHVIDGELITSVYAHMEYDSRRFEVGDTVEVGDVIGTTGDTGMSTGPHLHFEIRIGGINGTKVDPLEWLYANTN
jgi:murein DD-endopeptidase MepM/ murein hydrolase activator NlpD